MSKLLREWNRLAFGKGTRTMLSESTNLQAPDDRLEPELQEISKYGLGFEGSSSYAIGYLDESPLLDDKTKKFLRTVNTDPMGDRWENPEWKIGVGLNDDGTFSVSNGTGMENWGTGMPIPESRRDMTHDEVIAWIQDMAQAAVEFSMSWTLADKGEFGYVDDPDMEGRNR